ncbi:uncharacterized protein KIAA0408 homolog isoform X3 [Monodelphis domestica]|uniref:uncharacterized protein KIAA0408 homolog isoform X3 n=1 Tax=Monodelphis domestica TaxID=13616 RepID=UPI0024E1C2C6|nr:uncharacterized protein KIAA0408 homolog isoform X3 [Monodelphis domestica]
MDLQKQWETTETNWIKERMELLDQFDNERKEWESQWKVMQKKIEELCQEVKLRRESKKNGCSKTIEHDTNVQSKMVPFLPHSPNSGQRDTAVLSDGLCTVSLSPESMKGGGFLEEKSQLSGEQTEMRKSKAVLMDTLVTENQKKCEGRSDLKISEEEKKSCTNALNTALEELAKVSEELCSFQEEIRKRTNHGRMKSTPFPEETKSMDNPDMNHMNSNGPQADLISFDIEKTINKEKLIHFDDMPHNNSVENGIQHILPLQRNEIPPIPPPRSSSRNLQSSYSEDLLFLDGPKENLDNIWETQDCKGERNCSNNFLAKQYKAIVPCPYTWKALKDDVIFATSVPNGKTDSENQCNKDSETNIWSHHINSLETGSKSVPSTFCFPNTCPNPDKLPCEKLSQSHQVRSDSLFHVSDDLSFSLKPNSDPLTEADCNFEKISKNEKLAAKTDEFNRTVFRTDRCCSSAQNIQQHLNSSKETMPCGLLCTCVIHSKENDNLYCIRNKSPLVPKERRANSFDQKITGGQVKQTLENPNVSNYHLMLHEHNWRPSNLLGRPRSADPKSNYGVVEKLLKNYEKSTGPLSQNSKCCQDQWTKLDCNVNVIKSDKDIFNQCFEMFQPEEEKQELQMKSVMSVGQQSKQGIERKKLTEVRGDTAFLCGAASEFSNRSPWQRNYPMGQGFLGPPGQQIAAHLPDGLPDPHLHPRS